ncbi:hypothetical protein [Salsipaludibacter albus]|uniref:hypothetical protein n=1 Tax=Salsipaludibacter albus TaxID=2849650 RepID=UPI001EE49A3F|nr:hypothetical protein [Salsipaludibacter albus]MBY5162491.1 hypothetical protein [Salsipaludibacter albus]
MKRKLAALLSAATLVGCSVIATTATAAEDKAPEQGATAIFDIGNQKSDVLDMDLVLGFMGIFDIG